jgi:hypothetical protein
MKDKASPAAAQHIAAAAVNPQRRNIIENPSIEQRLPGTPVLLIKRLIAAAEAIMDPASIAPFSCQAKDRLGAMTIAAIINGSHTSEPKPTGYRRETPLHGRAQAEASAKTEAAASLLLTRHHRGLFISSGANNASVSAIKSKIAVMMTIQPR